MSRIFLTLSIASIIALIAAFALGLSIGDAYSRDANVQYRVGVHFLTAIGALMLVCLVHALVFTYFMGTSRWMEETTRAYKLTDANLKECLRMKYRTLPGIILCFLLLLTTGAVGGAADPASPIEFKELAGLSAGTIHMLIALITIGINLVVFLYEYMVIYRNGELIQNVMSDVRRIREEHGLPV